MGVTGRVLAVDGGGSKTDVVLVDADGAVLARAQGATSSPHLVGLPAALAVLDGLVAQVSEQVGHAAGYVADHAAGYVADHAAVYLSGLDLPQELELIRPELAARGWARTLEVDNDTFALLRAGTQARDAVAVVCGTGINCVGRNASGALSRFVALGSLSGDWGGGWHLGQQALWHATRADDGRGTATALQRVVAEHYGRPDALAVGVAVHLGEIDSESLRDLAPAVLDAAGSGDAVAASLVDRLAEEVAVLTTVSMRRLELTSTPVDLVLGGGVLRSRDERLLTGVATRVQDVNPRTRVVVVDDDPVVGAALLGLDVLGADASAHQRLRRSLGERTTVSGAGPNG